MNEIQYSSYLTSFQVWSVQCQRSLLLKKPDIRRAPLRVLSGTRAQSRNIFDNRVGPGYQSRKSDVQFNMFALNSFIFTKQPTFFPIGRGRFCSLRARRALSCSPTTSPNISGFLNPRMVRFPPPPNFDSRVEWEEEEGFLFLVILVEAATFRYRMSGFWKPLIWGPEWG